MKISKCKVIWSIKSRIFKQKTVLTKISLNSHSTKKRSRFRHPYRFMNLDFLGHFGILVNRSFSSAPVSMTFLTFGTYVINCWHPKKYTRFRETIQNLSQNECCSVIIWISSFPTSKFLDPEHFVKGSYNVAFFFVVVVVVVVSHFYSRCF